MSESFITVLPLLLLIVIGFVAGKLYKLSTVQYGYMVAFILAPLVSFGAVLQLDFQPAYIALPLVVAALSCSVAFLGLYFSRLFLTGSLPNLVGMAGAGGNTGFFGVPLFLVFFPANMLGVYLLANLGMQIIEVSIGYYIAARGNCTMMDSFKKLLKMPPLWAVLVACILNSFNVGMPDIIHTYWEKTVDAWLVIGMMMIGIALASCENLRPDVKFCFATLVVRFLIWPALTAIFILLDMHFLELLNMPIYFILAIFALVPLAGNAVALSATLGLHPDKMAFSVVLTTVIAALATPFLIDKIYGFLF